MHFMLTRILKAIFGSKSSRDIKRLMPKVRRINEIEAEYQKLTEEQLIAAGVKPGKTFVIAMITGLVEVVGTLLGYFAVSAASVILPFALAFAGGTMLYVVSDEMMLETHAHGHERGATYSLLVGFCLMLVVDVLLG